MAKVYFNGTCVGIGNSAIEYAKRLIQKGRGFDTITVEEEFWMKSLVAKSWRGYE